MLVSFLNVCLPLSQFVTLVHKACQRTVWLETTGAPAEKPFHMPSSLPYDALDCSVMEPRTPSSDAAYNPQRFSIFIIFMIMNNDYLWDIMT
jgi:hypothetical protein